METTFTSGKVLSRVANHPTKQVWCGPQEALGFSEDAVSSALLRLQDELFVVQGGGQVGIASYGELSSRRTSNQQPGEWTDLLAILPPLPIEQLGDPSFNACYGTRFAYYGGAMASAISSAAMVIALGKAGLLGSFGAAGLPPARLEAAIQQIQAELPEGPYAFNLIHSPNEEALERRAVELYLRYGIRAVEASAFLDLTPHIVYYRAAGLSTDENGKIQINNRVIAKISRREVASRFMQPAPDAILAQLVKDGKITEQQAALAQRVPVADDITVEADSGGHTDNRPLVCLMPAMLALRDEMQEKYQYDQPVRVGAAGGISTPAAALAAFAMGAAFI
ncbi:MAG: 2-nitropropane dioxygenase, partial [Chloroflexi bacterium]